MHLSETFVSFVGMKEIVTPTEFSERHKIGRSTVWRWINREYGKIKLKEYGAKTKVIAGKTLIEINKK